MAVINTEPKIELLYRPAAGGAGVHSFIVYTDSDGEKWAFSGSPEESWPSFGDLLVEFAPLVPSSYDFAYYADQAGTNTSSNIIARGSELSSINVMQLLGITARTINEGEIDYNMIQNAANSNSAVAAALEILGLSSALNEFPPPSGTVGIYNNLGANTWGLDIDNCFPANTQIQLSDGTEKAIADITVLDEVAAFHPAQFAGRGGLASQKVVRLFENITDVWIKLSNGIVVTPGHHFLDAKGNFRTIETILASDGEIISANGEVIKVSGEYIHYSAKTADMFEQAEGYVAQSVGNTALAPTYKKGWKTYNFEVANYHTYVADGVRVHNHSLNESIGSYNPALQALVDFIQGLGGQLGYDLGLAKLWAENQNDAGSNEPIVANNTQITGTGPLVTLASGTVVNAGTIFNSGSGYTYVVNADGSTTNLNTGYTYGDNHNTGGGNNGNGTGGNNGNGNGNGNSTGNFFDDASDFVSDVAEAIGEVVGDFFGAIGDFFNDLFTPIILDLDRDGIEITTRNFSGVSFDYDNDGFIE